VLVVHHYLPDRASDDVADPAFTVYTRTVAGSRSREPGTR
jgi:hypothetical protein